MSADTDVKITHTTLTGDQLEALHRGIDQEVERVWERFGAVHPNCIGGPAVLSPEGFDDVSPHDTRISLGRFQQTTPGQVRDAVAAAVDAFPTWARQPWRERVAAVRRMADAIRSHRCELAALMGFEAGKNRLECLGDVEETAELIAYYCDELERHDGFVTRMGTLGPTEENRSVLRPYGVWAVISPFNFPLALAGGPAGAALVAGNTVVLKPASDTPWLGFALHDMAAEAGLPPGVLNVVTGQGAVVGRALVDSPGVAGVVFTGARDVGMSLIRDNASRSVPRPLVAEMGGKNPALVLASADLEKAADGVLRSAFGAQGQKCSACSRVYVAHEVRERFVEVLAERTAALVTGNPLDRGVWHGPLINARAVGRFEEAVAEARRDGGRIVVGGRRLTAGPYAHGYFVEPTVIEGLPASHRLLADELFVPITVVVGIASLDEGLSLANDTVYGLTAGIFTENEAEVAELRTISGNSGSDCTVVLRNACRPGDNLLRRFDACEDPVPVTLGGPPGMWQHSAVRLTEMKIILCISNSQFSRCIQD